MLFCLFVLSLFIFDVEHDAECGQYLVVCILQEMLEKISATAAETVDGAKPQCFVLFALSHGEKESVYGTDGQRLKKTKIIDELDGCENLRGVPRLLFLQCCRGSTIEVSVVPVV